MFNTVSNWLDALNPGGRTSARNGWKTPAVWGGLNKISGNIGILPMVLKRRNGESTEIVRAGRIPNLWRNPSPMYRSNVFKQTMTHQAIWHGNGRAAIIRNGMNSELIILDPEQTETGMVNGEKMHLTYIRPDGEPSGPSNRLRLYENMTNSPDRTITLFDRDVFHLVGFGNGIVGIPLYEAVKTILESMLGSDELINDQINRGFTNKIVLSAPESSPMFRDEAKANEFLQAFVEKHGTEGLNDAVMLLRGGITASTLTGMTNDQAQMIEIKKYFREDAALSLMLENMLGINDGNSYNSHEQRQLAYLLNLETWLTRWEEEADFKLLSDTQFISGNYYHEFNTEKLTRTDKKTTAETASSLITSRVLNPNEVRAQMGLDPYEGGDEFVNPAISPMEKDQDTETVEDEQNETSDEPNVQALLAIQSRLDVLLNQEQIQVNKRLTRGDSIETLEQWYSGYESRLGNAIVDCGGDRQIGIDHCQSSLKHLRKHPKHFDLNGTCELLAQQVINKELINV